MGIDKELANDIMLAMVTLELGGASRRAIYKLRTALQ
jgi:hypothetical protein